MTVTNAPFLLTEGLYKTPDKQTVDKRNYATPATEYKISQDRYVRSQDTDHRRRCVVYKRYEQCLEASLSPSRSRSRGRARSASRSPRPYNRSRFGRDRRSRHLSSCSRSRSRSADEGGRRSRVSRSPRGRKEKRRASYSRSRSRSLDDGGRRSRASRSPRGRNDKRRTSYSRSRSRSAQRGWRRSRASCSPRARKEQGDRRSPPSTPRKYELVPYVRHPAPGQRAEHSDVVFRSGVMSPKAYQSPPAYGYEASRNYSQATRLLSLPSSVERARLLDWGTDTPQSLASTTSMHSSDRVCGAGHVPISSSSKMPLRAVEGNSRPVSPPLTSTPRKSYDNAADSRPSLEDKDANAMPRRKAGTPKARILPATHCDEASGEDAVVPASQKASAPRRSGTIIRTSVSIPGYDINKWTQQEWRTTQTLMVDLCKCLQNMCILDTCTLSFGMESHQGNQPLLYVLVMNRVARTLSSWKKHVCSIPCVTSVDMLTAPKTRERLTTLIQREYGLNAGHLNNNEWHVRPDVRALFGLGLT